MRAGDAAPDFTLPDQTGAPLTLSARLADGPVVLFFFPYALTTGCTLESCHFRDLGPEFARAGAQRIGISRDPVARQREFADKYGFDYPLLADTEGTVAAAFGVRRRLLATFSPVRRATFVIGTDGVVLEVIAHERKFELHADGALQALARA